jgi:predicted secreted hydrolase
MSVDKLNPLRHWLPVVAFILALVALLAVYGTHNTRHRPAADASPSLTDLLGADDDGADYTSADGPRTFAFPADHGPHPRFKHEWWYFTGNLVDANGRRFGYQATFFRIALTPKAVPRQSHWGADQLYMVHFAVTDPVSEAFHAFERFERGALGLAGAQVRPFRVWTDDWRVESVGVDTFPARLRAAAGDVKIDLTLAQGKPVVLEGDNGLSRKGDGPGEASYYYSLTRMPTQGTVEIDHRRFKVRGASWMDREWASSTLAANQAGWDWFALQLSDDRELMYYRLRDKDGGSDPHSAGTLVAPDDRVLRLGPADVTLSVVDTWRSPHSGARYPARWRVAVPGQDLSLRITPLLADQELNFSVTYWEGAVKVSGVVQGHPVSGAGYLEMTGYAGRRQ